MSLIKIFNILTNKIIDDSKTKEIDNEYIYIWNYLFNQVRFELTLYSNKNIINFIPVIVPISNDNIILTMTTCKRLSLFKQTVNSIFNNWKDIHLVNYWLVVDDNSSQEDRKEMINLYPFIDYIMKPIDKKGHMNSMNIIYDKLKKLNKFKYWIHIEDDFLFFYPTNYISKAIIGLNELKHFNVKQIMFNRNYTELFSDINLKGHINYSDNNYSLHDYQPNGINSTYWSNFSLRPSMILIDAILSIGSFDSSEIFFEGSYAKKYTEFGYRTGFFNTITNIHIGRLTNTEGDNAYSLNNVPQFYTDKIINDIQVINLKRRPDRKEKIISILEKEKLPYEIVEAVDGKELKESDKMLKLFDGNDFNNRRNIIGCALSHYNLWKKLVKSNDQYYIIMEDDVTLCKNFKNIILNNIFSIKNKNIIFFGYLMTNNNKNKYLNKYYNESDIINISPINKSLFIGGTHCYSITKEAASSLIDFIDIYGIKNGIDYFMVKVQQINIVYESVPHIAFAEWNEFIDNKIDSDIQYDFSTININNNKNDDNFVFIKNTDQIGNDIKYVKSDNIDILKNIANLDDNCVAFNSLGFFKNNIINLTKSNYYSENDGIYIKKNYYDNYLKKK